MRSEGMLSRRFPAALAFLGARTALAVLARLAAPRSSIVRASHLLFVVVAILAVAGPAGGTTRGSAASAPEGLHGFLLRVDEPRSNSFSRTPSFAWNPVAGAVRYEFQLSTSGAFRESGIVYSDTSLTSPVAAPALTLPWITGTPHALYARVRAVLADATTSWGDAFGFDMQPPAPPVPLSSYPGLLRGRPSTAPRATRSGSWTSRRSSS